MCVLGTILADCSCWTLAYLASEAAAVDAHAGGSVLPQCRQQLRDPLVAFIHAVVAAADQQCVERSGL